MADPEQITLLLGELTGTVRGLGDSINRQNEQIVSLSRDVQETGKSFQRLEHGLQKANDDIRSLKASVVTHEHLLSIGVDVKKPQDTKEDIEFLREQRSTYIRRRPILDKAFGGVVAAAVLGIAAWAWGAASDKFKMEIRNDVRPPSTTQAAKD